MRCPAATPRRRPAPARADRAGPGRRPRRARRAAGTVALAVLAALAGAAAWAGPWPREEGQVFVALTASAGAEAAALAAGTATTPETAAALYAEYGLGRGLTLGADLSGDGRRGRGVVFLRRTLTAPDATWQVAFDAGAGWDAGGAGAGTPLLRFGAALGRGIGPWQAPDLPWPARPGLGHDGGWTSLDAVVLHDPDAGDTRWSAEATLGLRLAAGWRAALALKAEDGTGAAARAAPLLTARPAVMVDLGTGLTLSLGASLDLSGGDRAGLSLGLWGQF